MKFKSLFIIMILVIAASALFAANGATGQLIGGVNAADASGDRDSEPSWIERSPFSEPPNYEPGIAMAYDSGRDVTVLYIPQGPAQTWEWDGTNWTQRFPDDNPGLILGGAMVYDSARSVNIFFGEGTTWQWDGTNWTQLFPEDNPGNLYKHSMAYDSARGVTALFGGSSSTDTWEWNGTNWIQYTSSNQPSARMCHAMVYDSQRGVTVLFGGVTEDYSTMLNDTWEWDGTDWQQRTPVNSPGGRESHAMAYDSDHGVTILNGGYGESDGTDTWAWDGINWIQLSPPSNPGKTWRHTMSFDSARGVTVLFDGSTWEFAYSGEHPGDPDPTPGPPSDYETEWILHTPTDKPSARNNHAMAYDSVRGVTVLFGGVRKSGVTETYLSDTWEWDGTIWTQKNPTNKPTERSGHAMVYDSRRGVTVLFGGGLGGVNYYNDTWEWDGTDWTQRFSTNTPPKMQNHTLAYDSERGVTVLWGGQGREGGISTVYLSTYEWDGEEWRSRSSANKPTCYYRCAMAYDSVRDVSVLFGGVGSGNGTLDFQLDKTWEWNGIDWLERASPFTPPGRNSHAMVFDTMRGLIVLFGGFRNPDGFTNLYLNDTWEWNGTEWVEQPTMNKPLARSLHAMAYDSVREVSVLFGGSVGTSNYYTDTWEYSLTRAPDPEPTPDPNGQKIFLPLILH